jgi:hypothetical protein
MKYHYGNPILTEDGTQEEENDGSRTLQLLMRENGLPQKSAAFQDWSIHTLYLFIFIQTQP